MNSSIKLKTAENLFRNKDWAGASRLLYQVLENESEAKPERLFVLLSAALRHQRKYRESEAIAEEGRRLYPRNKDIGLQYADAATALHDWYAAVDRWNDLIETFGADVPAIAYVRLADAYRHLYKFDESDKAISAGKQLHGEALEKHIHLPVHEEERFLSILDRLPLFKPGKRFAFVYVPQIELSPYVAALLRHIANRLGAEFLIAHPESNEFSKRCFSGSARYHTIDNEIFKYQWTTQKFELLIEYARLRGATLCTFVSHTFDFYCVQLLRKYLSLKVETTPDLPDIVFYADGSRNNKESEHHPEQRGVVFKEALKSNLTAELYEFGYSSPSVILKEYDDRSVKKTVLDYAYVDHVYRQVNFSFTSSAQDVIRDAGRVALVLTRYWGREPYFFRDADALFSAAASSIVNGCLGCDTLILRKDNRFKSDYSRLLDAIKATGKFKRVINIEDLISCHESSLEEMLFECVMHRTDLLEKIDVIYCFDSSFPLVFLSPRLRQLAHRNLIITSGFDYQSVAACGTAECIEVMIDRTVKLVRDLLNIGLYSVSDSLGELVHANGKAVNMDTMRLRLRANGGNFLIKLRGI